MKSVAQNNLLLKNHRLSAAHWLKSPNQDLRPEGVETTLLVIHTISLPPGEFDTGAVERLFTNALDWDEHPYYQTIKNLKISAHVLIDRGGKITQFVDFDKRAWHAGQSCFKGQDKCNDYSIGLELEGDEIKPYTDEQYLALENIANLLIKHYPIKDVAGHSDIAPGRKTDPGEVFDWERFRKSIKFS